MFLAMIALAAAQPPEVRLARPFEGMEFLLGHCWQATFPDGKTDTHCFEPVYGKRFIGDRHEVTGGYQGETLYSWDPARLQADYTYWASSGGVSRGTMRERDGLLDFADQVHRLGNREIRISTTWKQIDPTSYEVRTTSDASPTGSRVLRYVRVDAAPVRVEEKANADGSRTLAHEIVVPAPPPEVYAAIASPEGWRTWAVPNAWAASGNADLMETSYTPGAVAGDVRNIQQRFLLRVPDSLVAFRTVRTPPGFPHAAEFQGDQPRRAGADGQRHPRAPVRHRLPRGRRRRHVAGLLQGGQPHQPRAAAHPLRHRPDRLGPPASARPLRLGSRARLLPRHLP